MEKIEKPKKCSTGIVGFDPILEGGIPSGSVVLLVGEVGAGQNEFAYTSSAKLALQKGDNKETKEFEIIFPKKICYVSIYKSKEDIVNEIKHSFKSDYVNAFENLLVFKDLSPSYFRYSSAPMSWTDDGILSLEKKEEILEEALVHFLEKNAKDSLVIIDSLTDLVTGGNLDFNMLLSILRGLQRASKKWNSMIYCLLTKDVVDKSKEELIADCFDGVLYFEWEGLGSIQRRRSLYIKKFRGLMPLLEEQNIARYDVKITSKNGFEVENVQAVG